MDSIMARLERAGVQGECGPKLNEEVDPEEWFAKSDGGKFEPKPKLENEKPQGETVDYDELIKSWEG
jgi:glycerol transport system substrate-binding protein